MFSEKKFTIPQLNNISSKNIEEHLKLYAGYVKNANLILDQITKNQSQDQEIQYSMSELQRRFSFEFDGMRNHEYYFTSLEGGAHTPSESSPLMLVIEKQWGSFENFIAHFKSLAMTRGVGWAMLYYDKISDRLLTAWVEEQHLGHLTGLPPILALDMWEHAYVYDYPTSEKKKYIEAFFENLNWSVIEKNFLDSQ